MKLYDLKVNHLTKPLGFRMTRCTFSWKVAEAAGMRQKAARVVVAADEKLEQILFDSGFDNEANFLAYRAEVDLRPRTRYYWTVTVRTDAGEEAVGEVQWFETGKRDEDWTGKWVSCQPLKTSPDDQKKGVVSDKRHPYFEREISPQKEVVQARLYICGLGLYEAYYTQKNGETVRIGEE